jgi:hypothetical protein
MLNFSLNLVNFVFILLIFEYLKYFVKFNLKIINIGVGIYFSMTIY